MYTFIKLELVHIRHYQWQIASLIMLWCVVLVTLIEEVRYSFNIIWMLLPLWVLAMQPLLSQLYNGSMQQLILACVDTRLIRYKSLVHSMFLSLPFAVIFGIGTFHLVGGITLFLVLDLMLKIMTIIMSATQKIAHLLFAQALFVPLIFPLILLGMMSSQSTHVLELLFGVWLLCLGYYPKFLRLAIRVGL
ncbi:hypothetical protein MMH89_02380 [Candidatus Comchoanobacter bicostacola]|uniref:Uncharacterized protein n=1 Tax=Candidatus Comchoanobacter bicostacola TaxID=2919598 RepID=A0ABY5DKG5_9GAMM|nr:hypothetical protein [Candidatus Comchoanobacter bicostacola]UTC24991.1 hypothetical protein MMH89_02380 [Candidatus Comchoanobacter bicostacola]